MIYMFEYMYIYNMIIGLFMSSLEVDVDIIFFVEPFIPKGSANQSLGWCIFLLKRSDFSSSRILETFWPPTKKFPPTKTFWHIKEPSFR